MQPRLALSIRLQRSGFGRPGRFEPEKEILLTIVPADQVDAILDAIVGAGELNDTGRGIAFVVPVEKVAGVARFMTRTAEQE